MERQLSLSEGSVSPAEFSRDPGTDYGEVFTRRWVVELILDLVGYTETSDLGARRLVEPSCGSGAFLLPVVERLIASCVRHGRDLRSITGAVRAFDLFEANAQRARKSVALRLEQAGLHHTKAAAIATTWVATGDFLLTDHERGSADFVVGNPPYIRPENVRRDVMEVYRRRYATMRGRSDVYVGFLEQGLYLLGPDRTLGFICADRWMRNQYGADLRALVSRRFAVDAVITMHDADAFEDDVAAYPAIVVLRNGLQRRAIMAQASAQFGDAQAPGLSDWARRSGESVLETSTVEASRLQSWFNGRDLWPTGNPAQLALIAELESRFPPLEDTRSGTRVGIGVATGCDDVYVTKDADLVEEDRLLPLLHAVDITDGSPAWSGQFLVNPWDGDGLVDLDRYPRLRRFFQGNADRLRNRHIARKNPAQWYRTIDRVHPNLQRRPKLVLPDIKGASHPVIDTGSYYPHHNLYFVTSDHWDLEVLGGLLLSEVANLFVGAYCVKMRGGCFRFQAQYLRRIRVPDPEKLSRDVSQDLAFAFANRDVAAATAAAATAYGLPLPSVMNAIRRTST